MHLVNHVSNLQRQQMAVFEYDTSRWHSCPGELLPLFVKVCLLYTQIVDSLITATWHL